ncbi:MAG: hypothetical protein Q8L34_02095 [Candidatus Woesearchaeota archaeon]|nr:hypothetical protein [Candidatus Woesearchaeota archaeon]
MKHTPASFDTYLQDKQLFDATIRHDLATFRKDQQRLAMTLDQVLSPLS